MLPCQCGKSRQWRPLMAIERRRNSPYAAFARAKFLLLLARVFVKSVRRVGDDRMEAVIAVPLKPVETIRIAQFHAAKTKHFGRTGQRFHVAGQFERHLRLQRVATAICPAEMRRRIQTEIGTYGRGGRRPEDLPHAGLDFLDGQCGGRTGQHFEDGVSDTSRRIASLVDEQVGDYRTSKRFLSIEAPG